MKLNKLLLFLLFILYISLVINDNFKCPFFFFCFCLKKKLLNYNSFLTLHLFYQSRNITYYFFFYRYKKNRQNIYYIII